jgi:C1A family cysteine protease
VNFFKKKLPVGHKQHKFSLKSDKADDRDYWFRDIAAPKLLPKSVDLRDKMQPIYDQGQLGSCQSNAADAIDAYIKGYSYIPSHLFTYYNVRLIENTVDEDSGGTLRDTCKALAQYGTCDSKLWTYDISKFAEKPPEEAYSDAKSEEIISYYRISSLIELKQALADGHIPFIGIIVYENFESAQCMSTGIIPAPKGNRLGGHAMDIVGYYDSQPIKFNLFSWLLGKKTSTGNFILRNSWGTGIGLDGTGYFQISYENFQKIVMDEWVIVK